MAKRKKPPTQAEEFHLHKTVPTSTMACKERAAEDAKQKQAEAEQAAIAAEEGETGFETDSKTFASMMVEPLETTPPQKNFASAESRRVSLHASKIAPAAGQLAGANPAPNAPGEELQASLAFLDGLRARRRATMAATSQALATTISAPPFTKHHSAPSAPTANTLAAPMPARQLNAPAAPAPATPEAQVMRPMQQAHASAKKLAAYAVLPSERLRRFTLAASAADKPLLEQQDHRLAPQPAVGQARRQTLSLARARDRLFHGHDALVSAPHSAEVQPL